MGRMNAWALKAHPAKSWSAELVRWDWKCYGTGTVCAEQPSWKHAHGPCLTHDCESPICVYSNAINSVKHFGLLQTPWSSKVSFVSRLQPPKATPSLPRDRIQSSNSHKLMLKLPGKMSWAL